jgi:predicted DNA-binding protein (MmcQ/YjbR family)
MNIDSVRKFCLSFPHATEKLQWGEELCFKVRGKIFAMVGLASVPQTIICKCDPQSFAALTELEGIHPAPYVGRYKWVMLERLDALSDLELRDVITNSYDLVAAKAKAPKSKRRHSNSVKRGS